MIVAQQEILMLRMDIDQAASQFLQDGKRYGRIVDESSRLAGSEQFAPEDTGGRIKLQVVVEEEAVELIFRDVESRFDDTSVSPVITDNPSLKRMSRLSINTKFCIYKEVSILSY